MMRSRTTLNPDLWHALVSLGATGRQANIICITANVTVAKEGNASQLVKPAKRAGAV